MWGFHEKGYVKRPKNIFKKLLNLGRKELEVFFPIKKKRKFGNRKLTYSRSYYRKKEAVNEQNGLINRGLLAKVTEGKEFETGKTVYRLWEGK